MFRAQAAAQEVVLAVLLRDDLGSEVRDALAAPWAFAFGDPLDEAVAASS